MLRRYQQQQLAAVLLAHPLRKGTWPMEVDLLRVLAGMMFVSVWLISAHIIAQPHRPHAE